MADGVSGTLPSRADAGDEMARIFSIESADAKGNVLPDEAAAEAGGEADGVGIRSGSPFARSIPNLIERSFHGDSGESATAEGFIESEEIILLEREGNVSRLRILRGQI